MMLMVRMTCGPEDSTELWTGHWGKVKWNENSIDK